MKVKIQNFYGIEINDFAVSVARTAMWIAESQMWNESQNIIYSKDDFLPLDSNDSIYEGNALRMNWSDIVKPHMLDYIMGNPPFIGKKEQTKTQKLDLKNVFDGKSVGNLDYVTGWYKKAADFIKGTTLKVSFVSTNSISQGEQVSKLWTLLQNYGLIINFAYRTFVWNNEAKHKANVHVIIIGFSNVGSDVKEKLIYGEDNVARPAQNISPYLIDAPSLLITSKSKPVSDVSPMVYGSMPIDNGHLILNTAEKRALVSRDKDIERFIRPYYGGREMLHSSPRYCLWMPKATPSELRNHPAIMDRINATHEFREQSNRSETIKAAEQPFAFGEIRQPTTGKVIVLPKVSSQRRQYIPIDYMDSFNIINGSLLMIPNADLYMFGVLNSSVHNTWMRVVAGRMKSDYQYSARVVYNNFVWPAPNKEAKKRIERTAEDIIAARRLDSSASLADLYDPDNFKNFEVELHKAHKANDDAVLKAYGLSPKATEQEIIQYLFKMYEKMTGEKK